jgi:hypothetical protein
MKLLPIQTESGYFHGSIGCSANTAEELGEKLNAILWELGNLNAPAFELVDVKYSVSSPKQEVLIFSTQIIFRSKQKIDTENNPA